MNGIIKSINRVSLIQQIIIGLIIGILAALFVPEFAKELSLLGVLFAASFGSVMLSSISLFVDTVLSVGVRVFVSRASLVSTRSGVFSRSL